MFERLLVENGIGEFNGPQGRILYVLWKTDGVPIAKLVQETGLAKNTLTSMLARMETAGLILRRQSETDRRITVVSLTEKSRRLEQKYNEVSAQMNRLFYGEMPPEDAVRLDGLLDRVLQNLLETERTMKKQEV